MSNDFMDEVSREEGQTSESHGSVSEEPQDGGKKSNEAAAVAFIFFFIAEMIAMPVCAQIDPLLCASCLGLLLLVIGIIAVKQKISWENWGIAFVPAAGVILTALPVVDHISRKKTGETFFTTDRITIIVSSVFMIIGVLAFVMPFLERHVKLKKCTRRVIAKCISLDKQRVRRIHSTARRITSIAGRNRGRISVYAPKWEYRLDGEVYHQQEYEYVNMFVPRVGEEHEIFVDPGDPHRIYRVNKGVFVPSVMFGIGSMIICALTIYMVFFAQ